MSRQTIYEKLKAEEKKLALNADGAGRGLDTVYSLGIGDSRVVDPETGLVVEGKGVNAMVIGRMGDEKVTAFVNYHMDMMGMRQGVDKSNVQDLYNRFIIYLKYCSDHGIVPNNMNCYFAMGITRQNIAQWRSGRSSKAHQELAEMITSFFASIHEQGATDGVLNPISAMFWQKAHDSIIEASKLEVVQDNPLGERRSAEEISKNYTDLPD